MNFAYVGILFLGVFFGGLVSLTFKLSTTPTIQRVLQVVAVVFGGAPLAFMQDAASAKWAYPVGLVLGFFWGRKYSEGESKGARRRVGWRESILPGAVSIALVLAFAFLQDRSPSAKEGRVVARAALPCAQAWIFLGRFSRSRASYELPPNFRYPASIGQLPAIPAPGNVVITTTDLNLLVSGYTQATAEHKCDRILDPPWGYRPETAASFVAGRLPKNASVLITQVVLMPNAEADPTYVWGLIRVAE